MKLLIENFKKFLTEESTDFLQSFSQFFDEQEDNIYTKKFRNGECEVSITLSKNADGYNIDHIETSGENCMGQGFGTAVMEHTVKVADDHGITLTLYAQGYPGGPSDEKLEDWYWNLGFESADKGMRREPESSVRDKIIIKIAEDFELN